MVIDRYPLITLDIKRDAEAVAVGQARQDNAILEGRIPGAGLKADYDHNLILNINGARAELAAKLYADPVKWNDFKTGPLDNTPDLEDYIDVKWIGKPHNKLIVGRNGKPGWVYFLVDGSQHPTYRMVGWCWGWEAMHGGTKSPYWHKLDVKREEQWNIPQSATFMRAPEDLLFMIRVLQKNVAV